MASNDSLDLPKLRRHNALLGRLTGKVEVTPDGEGQYRASIGGRSITLVNPNRWRRYRFGIPRQLRRLAHTYGALPYADAFSGRTVLDIGANIGEFSLFALSKGANVVAIEPDRTNLAALKRNLAGTPVRIVEKALWNESKTLQLFSAPAFADSGLIRSSTCEGEYDVEAIRLDDLTRDLALGEIYFIKGDAEGAEPEVLSGATETLARTHYIGFDCGPEREGADTVDASKAILSAAGFDVQLLKRKRVIVFGINRRFAGPGAPRAR